MLGRALARLEDSPNTVLAPYTHNLKSKPQHGSPRSRIHVAHVCLDRTSHGRDTSHRQVEPRACRAGRTVEGYAGWGAARCRFQDLID